MFDTLLDIAKGVILTSASVLIPLLGAKLTATLKTQKRRNNAELLVTLADDVLSQFKMSHPNSKPLDQIDMLIDSLREKVGLKLRPEVYRDALRSAIQRVTKT